MFYILHYTGQITDLNYILEYCGKFGKKIDENQPGGNNILNSLNKKTFIDLKEIKMYIHIFQLSNKNRVQLILFIIFSHNLSYAI